jgi:hypothetical protein
VDRDLATEPEIDTLLARIRGLVAAREDLRRRGAAARALDEHSAAIARLQGQLAERVRASVARG